MYGNLSISFLVCVCDKILCLIQAIKTVKTLTGTTLNTILITSVINFLFISAGLAKLLFYPFFEKLSWSNETVQHVKLFTENNKSSSNISKIGLSTLI